MSFGGHLRTLRQQAGVSRAELARRADVPANTLRHWEDDRGFPGVPASLRPAEGALGTRRCGWPVILSRSLWRVAAAGPRPDVARGRPLHAATASAPLEAQRPPGENRHAGPQ